MEETQESEGVGRGDEPKTNAERGERKTKTYTRSNRKGGELETRKYIFW